MTARAQLRHIRSVVAELDACRANVQPGGKYGGADRLVVTAHSDPAGTPSTVPTVTEHVRPWGTCSACGTQQPLRADGNILGHGPYGARCSGSYRLPAEPDGAT